MEFLSEGVPKSTLEEERAERTQRFPQVSTGASGGMGPRNRAVTKEA